MRTMPNNALEGARRAYFTKHSSRTDEHWEKWLQVYIYDSQGRVQNHLALARLCEDVLELFAEKLESSVLDHIRASQAYYRERAERQGYPSFG